MAEQMTEHAHAIPMNNHASMTVSEPTSASNPQIATFHDLNGSTNSLNGVNGSSTGGHNAYNNEHPLFCHHWQPPGVSATTDTSTVE
jgi:hypothetical protein